MLAFLLASLGMGLLGSLHCLGMCGGLSAALGFGVAPDHRTRLLVLASLGRVLSYGAIGLIAGGLVQSLPQSPYPRLLAALMLMLTGFYIANWWNLLARFEQAGAGIWRRMEPWRKRCLPINSSYKAVVFGLLWGALPCGLVYSALVYTAAGAAYMQLPAALVAAMGMIAFGIGTSPAVLIGSFMASQLKAWLQHPLLKPLLGVVYIGFGVWTAYGALAHRHHNHAEVQQVAPENHSMHEHHHH
jgi:uncharacterized protein